MKAPKALFIAIISCSPLTACGGESQTTAAASKSGDAVSGRVGARGGAGSPRKVTTVVAMEKSIDEVAIVTGTLAAEQDIVLGMKVAGRLSQVSVDLGYFRR